MKNEHLVPVNIQDIVNRLKDKSVGENERANLLLRLDAIRDYVTAAVVRANENSTSNRFTRRGS
jgi:hypothetical protein